MLKKRLFTFLLILAVSSCNLLSETNSEWKSDLIYLRSELPEKHINLFAIKSQNEFDKEVNDLMSETQHLNNFEVAIRIQQLLASLGDSHTKLEWGKFVDTTKIIPLHLYWFRDGIYILHTTQKNQKILGQKIVQINGIPIETIVDSLSTLLTIDNDAIIKCNIPQILPVVQILEYFGFVKNELIQLGLEDSIGNSMVYKIEAEFMDRKNRVMLDVADLALCYRNEQAFFIDYYLEEEQIYYLQYNKCWSRELENQFGNSTNIDRFPSFHEFKEKTFQIMDTKKINKLVIDLRFNRGGNSQQGTEYIEDISNYLLRNSNIALYVVLGRFTSSSAIINAMDFKKISNVIYIGEETSGKPNHFGEVKNLVLPNSKLIINYSTKYFKRSNDEYKTLKPEIILETSFNDFLNGIDPVLEWIKIN